MLVNQTLCLFCLVLLFNEVHVLLAANILALNTLASPSHHLWNLNILKALAARGHNVTSIGPDREDKVTPNLYELQLEQIYPMVYGADRGVDMFAWAEMNPFAEQMYYSDGCQTMCSGAMHSKGFDRIMSYPEDFKFDLVLYDCTCGPCLLSVLHKFHHPPIVAISAFSHPPYLRHFIGEHPHYAYVPFYSLSVDEDMTFGWRLLNTLVYLFDQFYRPYVTIPKMEKIVTAKLQKKLPINLDELEKTTSLALINSHPAFDAAQPLPPNIIEVAGLQIKEPKPLPKELGDFVKLARNCTIIFALGTNIRSDQLPMKIQQNILSAFEQLPDYHFLWKFESDSLPKHPVKNVLVRKWLPQNDLLAHPNVKLFITHGGMLSTQEAAYHGVPVIGIPFIVDQYRNVHKFVTAGVGERILYKTMTTDELKSTILKVLGNKSYAEKMQLRSKRFRDQATKPLDRAIWWIEWAIRNPNAEHLKSPILKLGNFAANLYDVWLTLLMVLGVFAFILFKFLRRIFNGMWFGYSHKNKLKIN